MTPWILTAISSLRDASVIPDAKVIGTWDVAQELCHLEAYQPLNELLSAICEVGFHLGEIKTKNSNDAGKLHHAIHSGLAKKITAFKDILSTLVGVLVVLLCIVILFYYNLIYINLINHYFLLVSSFKLQNVICCFFSSFGRLTMIFLLLLDIVILVCLI